MNRMTGLLLMAVLCISVAVHAQRPEPLPDPKVRIGAFGTARQFIPLQNGDLIIEGSFDHVGASPCVEWVKLRADGTIDCWPGPLLGGSNPMISAAAEAADGTIYIGGRFTHLDGIARNNLARLLPDGTVDPDWNPAPDGAEIKALALGANNALFVSGSFDSIGGAAVPKLAKLDAATGAVDMNWLPLPESPPSVLVPAASSALFVGGSFGYISGRVRNGLAKLSTTTGAADANWDPAPPAAQQSVQLVDMSLSADGSSLYVGGTFAVMGGLVRNGIAKLSTSGTGSADAQWTAPQPGAIARLKADAQGALYELTPSPWKLRKRDAVTGAVIATWTADSQSYLRLLTIMPNGDIRVGGLLNQLGGLHRVGHAAIAPDGQLLPSPSLTNPPIVSAMVRQPDGGLVIGGQFIDADGQRRTNILRIRPDGALDTAWTPSFDIAVNALAVDAVTNRVSVAGGFLNRIADVLADGTVQGASGSFTMGVPYALAYDGSGNLFAGGIGGVTRFTRNAQGYLLRDSAWQTNANSTVYALNADDPHLYVGGYFTAIGGLPRRYAARIFIGNGAADPTWDPSPSAGVRSFVRDASGNIVAGGDFLSIGGQNQAFLARLNPTTGAADPGWNPQSNGGVSSVIAGDGDTLYVGGEFTSLAGQPRARVAKLHASGPLIVDPQWNPGTDGAVRALAANGLGSLFVAGDFRHVATQERSGIAALPAPVPDAIFADGFEAQAGPRPTR